jgi:photosystem II stability/assembly factor-like uncharacterized protein
MSAKTLLLALALASGQPDPTTDKKDKDDKAPPVGAFRLRHLGPAVTSGRVVGFAIHPKDRSHYYVAVASGGVWKTTNAGTTWRPVFDNEGSYSIGYVAMDPSNPNVVWVGTGENNSQRSVGYGDGVYKSIDGGRSWTNVGLKNSEHIGKILIHPKDSNTVYVAAQGPLWGPGGDRGLYKTTDGGKTWDRILNIDDNTGVTDVVMDPRNPDILIAASYQRRRHVWTLINGGPGSAIHRSTDGGKTWKKITSGLPNVELGRIGLAIAPSDPDMVYAIVEAADRQGGIFRSTDLGLTWEKRNPFDSQAQYYAHIVVNPVDKNRIYVMNVRIQVSDDGGRTLVPLSSDNVHVDFHTLWIDPANPNYYLTGCDGGIYESFDRAASWHFKANLPVTQFYDISVDQNPASGPFYHVYGGTQDNFTLGGPVRTRSQHGITNADWYVVQGGDGFHCKVDPTDPNIVYAEYQYGGLCRYDRRTGNRVQIQPLAAAGEPPLRWNWDSPFIISPHNPKRLYFAANILFRSDDRGDSWTPVSKDLTRQLDRDKLPVMGKIWGPDAVAKHLSTSFYGNCVALAESPKKEGLIYVGTDDGLIQITEDGGQTWRTVENFPGVPEKTYVSKLVASQHDANTVFAAFDNHKNSDFKPYLLKSTDAGKSWTTIAGNLPERGTVYCLAEDHVNPDLLFCGTEFGLYVTTDGGKKWHRMRNGLPTIQVKDLVIQQANNDLLVGTFGRGIYILDDYSPLRELTPEVLEKTAHVTQPSEPILFIPSAQYGGSGKAFQGASFYTADNPPFGATFTVHLKESLKTKKQQRKDAEREAEKNKKDPPYPTKDELRAEAEEEPPAVELTITDLEGNILRTVPVPTNAGVHRVTWDLRESGVSVDGDGGRRGGGGGSLVMPGRYRATLVKRENGRSITLAGPVDVTVRPDPLSSLTPADYDEIAAFNAQVKALRRSMIGAQNTANDLADRLNKIRNALELAEKSDAEAKATVRDLIERNREILRALRGDSVLATRNENVPTSISELVSYAAFSSSGALAKPTGTQKDAYDRAAKDLATEVAKLRVILEKDLPPLEKKLDELGAPWTPGRLPTVRKD